jgi:tetratricopeptide (TPR) repeat protein
MQTTRSLFMLGDLPKETVVKNYDTSNSILAAITKENEDPQIAEDAVKVQAVVEEIFGTSGAADCEALISIFTPQYAENKNDIDFVKRMLRRLGGAKCDDSELFSNATEQLYNLEPSAEAAYNMARRFLKRDDDERAKNYYRQAIDQETDQDLLAKYYYEYALFIFAKEHDLQEARSLARKALEAKPGYCEANLLIGDIYVAANRTYGSDSFEKSTVFWVAVDYYEKARSNPDCAVDASQKISTYRGYFPNKEEAFFRSMQEGQSYKVGGWINETTRVRF